MITLMGKIIIFFYIIMPRRKKTPLLQHGGAGPTDECPICLESGSIQSDFLGTDYPMIQYCPNGHWAHIPCISQWLGTFSTSVDEGKVCPLCRENLSSTDLWININTSCKICGEQGTARIVDKPEIDYIMLPHCPNGHWSHEPCISTWLNGSYSCPNCERDLRNTTVWKKVNPNGNTSLKYQNNITDSLKDIQEKIKSNGKWKSIRNIGRNQPAPAQESLGIRRTERGRRAENEGVREQLVRLKEIISIIAARNCDGVWERFPLMVGTEECTDYATCYLNIYLPKLQNQLRIMGIEENRIPTRDRTEGDYVRLYGQRNALLLAGDDTIHRQREIDSILENIALGERWPEFYKRIGRNEPFRSFINRIGGDQMIFINNCNRRSN